MMGEIEMLSVSDKTVLGIVNDCLENDVMIINFKDDTYYVVILNENRTEDEVDYLARKLKVMLMLGLQKATGISAEVKVKYKSVDKITYDKELAKLKESFPIR